MDSKLDPRLRVLLDRRSTMTTREAARRVRVGVTDEDSVEVLLRTRGMPKGALEAHGASVHVVVEGAESIASVAVPASSLSALAGEEWVHEIEASRELFPELDLSIPECHANAVHSLAPSVRGRGVLVGIIDAGIDFKHKDFCNGDGTSRILLLWDQNAAAVANGSVPFGRVYTKADLDGVLKNKFGAPSVPHRDAGAHGTHVCGIAAGNGRAKNGKFVGVAPEADLLIVSAKGDGTLGQSNAAIAAYSWIVARAAELGRPVAINQSQGMNGGGHSGEAALEQAMDNLARLSGVVIVKSAGNEQQMRIHASGQLAQGQTKVVTFESGGSNVTDDIVEVWHDGADRISIAVQPPGAPAPTNFIAVGGTSKTKTSAKNEVNIVSTDDASNIGDVRTAIFISKGDADRIQPGKWRLHLRGDTIHGDGAFHAWIERSGEPRADEQAKFTEPSNDATISIPGTARRIITAGSFITRGDGSVGQISIFSSRGPTRYGLMKPELSAPGQMITSTRSSAANETAVPKIQSSYASMAGTSMAAPHVTGAAALLLQVNPKLNTTQAKQLLMRAARKTGFAAGAPDNTWGAGKLDVAEAVRLARTVVFPTITNVTVTGTAISWTTNVPTTAAVRFNTHQRRMLLGRSSGSLADLTLATQHRLDLAGRPPGTYFCEVLAFTADNWETLDDAGGRHHVVTV